VFADALYASLKGGSDGAHEADCPST
jgi:hypothetical protein